MNTYYTFKEAVGAFFLADLEVIRQKLPKELTPLEAHPGLGVVAVTAFDFSESMVGAYHEAVISILVSPWAPANSRMPHFALFPFFLGTDTEISRRHATEKWLFPSHDSMLEIDFHTEQSTKTVCVSDQDSKLFEMTVMQDDDASASRHYQAFSTDNQHVYRVDIDITGVLNEHERGVGEIIIGEEGAISSFLHAAIEDPIPIREQSMDHGTQIFDILKHHTIDHEQQY